MPKTPRKNLSPRKLCRFPVCDEPVPGQDEGLCIKVDDALRLSETTLEIGQLAGLGVTGATSWSSLGQEKTNAETDELCSFHPLPAACRDNVPKTEASKTSTVCQVFVMDCGTEMQKHQSLVSNTKDIADTSEQKKRKADSQCSNSEKPIKKKFKTSTFSLRRDKSKHRTASRSLGSVQLRNLTEVTSSSTDISNVTENDGTTEVERIVKEPHCSDKSKGITRSQTLKTRQRYQGSAILVPEVESIHSEDDDDSDNVPLARLISSPKFVQESSLRHEMATNSASCCPALVDLSSQSVPEHEDLPKAHEPLAVVQSSVNPDLDPAGPVQDGLLTESTDCLTTLAKDQLRSLSEQLSSLNAESAHITTHIHRRMTPLQNRTGHNQRRSLSTPRKFSIFSPQGCVRLPGRSPRSTPRKPVTRQKTPLKVKFPFTTTPPSKVTSKKKKVPTATLR